VLVTTKLAAVITSCGASFQFKKINTHGVVPLTRENFPIVLQKQQLLAAFYPGE
jgi:hypothetical protein